MDLSFLIRQLQGSCPVAGVPWKKPQNKPELEWEEPFNGCFLGAMGERILYTGDEVAFYINEKEAVKIGDTKVKPSF